MPRTASHTRGAARAAAPAPCRACALEATLPPLACARLSRHLDLCPCPRRAGSQAPCRRVAAPPSVWLPGAAAAPLRAPLAPACVGVGGRARLTATLPPAAPRCPIPCQTTPPQPHTRAARPISKFRERAMAPGELLRAGGGAWQASVGAGVVRSRRKIGVGGQARGGGVTAAGGGAAGTSRSQTRPRVGAKARRVSGVGARHGAAQQAARGRLPALRSGLRSGREPGAGSAQACEGNARTLRQPLRMPCGAAARGPLARACARRERAHGGARQAWPGCRGRQLPPAPLISRRAAAAQLLRASAARRHPRRGGAPLQDTAMAASPPLIRQQPRQRGVARAVPQALAAPRRGRGAESRSDQRCGAASRDCRPFSAGQRAYIWP